MKRGALVGLGVIGRGHWNGYLRQSSLEIVALADPLGYRPGGPWAGGLADVPCFPSLSELLDSVVVDFVDICSPPNTHVELLELAVDRGLHVICEKPVTHDEAQLPRLRVVLAGAETIVFPSHNYRFAPGICRLRETVHHEDFGSIVDVQFRTLRIRHARGTGDWYPDWRRDPAVSGGGVLRDHGPHGFYVMRFVTGLEPVALSCLMGDTGAGPTVPEGGRRVEDSILARIRFPGDIEARLELTWAAPRRQTIYQVTGTRQTATLTDDDFLVVDQASVCMSRERVHSDFNDVAHGSWFADVLVEFAAAIQQNTPQLRDFYAQRMLTEALDVAAAYESGRNGGAWTSLDSTRGGPREAAAVSGAAVAHPAGQAVISKRDTP